jgi:hypothetical protein
MWQFIDNIIIGIMAGYAIIILGYIFTVDIIHLIQYIKDRRLKNGK